MSSSASGQEKTVNTFGRLEFGRWRMDKTSPKEDVWRKPVISDPNETRNSYIELRRIIVDVDKRDFDYRIYFAGAAYILQEPFRGFYPGYQDHDSSMVLGESWEAQAAIDNFLERLNKLKAFL